MTLELVGFSKVLGEAIYLVNDLLSVLRVNCSERRRCLLEVITVVSNSFKALKYTDKAAVLLIKY